MPSSLHAQISTVKMNVLHHVNFVRSVILLPPPSGYWVKLDSFIRKFMWGNKQPQIKLTTLQLFFPVPRPSGLKKIITFLMIYLIDMFSSDSKNDVHVLIYLVLLFFSTSDFALPWGSELQLCPMINWVTTRGCSKGMVSEIYLHLLKASYKPLTLTTLWERDLAITDKQIDWEAVWENIFGAAKNPNHQLIHLKVCHRSGTLTFIA